MESSSEDSFLWTDASSDTCDDLMAEGNLNRNSGVKAESDGHQLHENNSNSNQHRERHTLHDHPQDNAQPVSVKKEKSYTEDGKRKRKIKLEPESEVDLPKKKKKTKHNNINNSPDDTQLSDPILSYDNSYLDTKVKQEMFTVPSNIKQKNKNKRKRMDSESQSNMSKESAPSTINDCNGEYVTGDHRLDIQHSDDSSYNKTKKNKKKSKKGYTSTNEHTDDMIVEDKFTGEETVVGYRPELRTDMSPKKKQNSTLKENDTFQGDSDGSCDEISAIKGDEDHNLHSTLFCNRDVEHETRKRKSRNSDHEEPTIEDNYDKSKYKPRTQKISDRIRFEEEEDSAQTIYINKPLNKKSSKVNHHLKTNTHLKPLTQHFISSSIITNNDDIWLLKCPKDIDVSAFKDIYLKMDGKYKIKISGQSYDSIAKEEESGRITVLSMENGQYRLKHLPLSGTINLKKRFPKPHFQEDNVMQNNQTNFIPLPETKCRHPLFGSNFKKALKVPSSVVQRLSASNNIQLPDDCAVSHSDKKKRKKHKKDKSLDVDSESHAEVTELKSEPEPTSEIKGKKKKKRKMVAEDESFAPKTKRIKHDPESAEAWESEKTIEENLFTF